MTMHQSKQAMKPYPRPSRLLTAALFALAASGALAMVWLTLLGCDPFSVSDASTRTLLSFVLGPVYGTLGSLIFVYRPQNRIGWLCFLIGFCLSGVVAADLYTVCGLEGTIRAPGKSYIAWFLYSYGNFPVIPLEMLLPMVYPSGHFLSQRWRRLALLTLTVLFVTGTGMGLNPNLSQDAVMHLFLLQNPLQFTHLPPWWPSLLNTINNLTFVVARLIAIAAIITRFRQAVGDERQQIKWLAYYLAITIGVATFLFNLPTHHFGISTTDTIWFNLGIALSFLGIPMIIGIAIFKYRLYDIDLIINRSLVYGGLTLAVVLFYTMIVVGSSRYFHIENGLPSSLIATGLIAVLFQPARERLQRAVNRLMFGQRDEPYTILSRLGQTLQSSTVPAETLTSLVAAVASTLKLPYVAIELIEHGAQIGQAAVGKPSGETIELPLRYQQETVGSLRVSPRMPGEKFTLQEEQLLADIAAQTGPVASATRLALALQRSREQLVLAREEERRRIRRDLHDGLGPTLASQTLKLDMILELLNGEAEQTVERVKALKAETQQMVADIRRLVYELRPPALDELGLLEALRVHIAQMDRAGSSLRIVVDASPAPLPALPAAIEVAAYRIALEAVTNVIRHAQAEMCHIMVNVAQGALSSVLYLQVTDNGIGLPVNLRAGIGMSSMRERAEELGGTCTIQPNPGPGIQIVAMLPFVEKVQAEKVQDGKAQPQPQSATKGAR